jgi:hypothetical protein
MTSKMGLTNEQIAEEIKSLLGNVQAMEKELPYAIVRWKRDNKNCNVIKKWQGQGTGGPNFMKVLCEKGVPYLTNYIINPLYKSMLDYRDLLLVDKAYTAGGKLTLLKGLLSSIYRYVIVTSYFGKNPSYLVPGSLSDKRIRDFQQEFKKTILQNNRRLMGCDPNSKFPIQTIAKQVKMLGEHQKILDYMGTQCLVLQTELLRTP